ncbi:MAG: nucleotidyl transferase AbiEii/AbiGii toxin family protein [Bacteroidales bacterium]
MIPRAHIIEWQKNAPWKTNAQIEQDLVIERALIELFSDDFIRETLAFRGGTALHKLFLKPQVRYSEDIDLVQIKPENIKPILQQIRNKLSFLGFKRSIKSNLNMNTIVYRFDTEIQPVVNSRLKIEINCREHFNVYGLNKKVHKIDNPWFSGETEINTYKLEELLGTKMRALYQRKKGRDLFDLYYALTNANVNSLQIIDAYKAYMKFSNQSYTSSKEFLMNMDDKMQDDVFLGDMKALLRPGIVFDMNVAYNLVKKELLEKI